MRRDVVIVRIVCVLAMAILAAGRASVSAQEKEQPKPAPATPAPAKEEPPKGKGGDKIGWSDTTDLSLVVTGGNSNSATLGFSNKLRRAWKDARFTFDVKVVRSDKSDDRFFVVDPGIEFPVGGAPVNPGTSLVRPDPTPDVATYEIKGGYERDISPKVFWNAGASWDRNDDAGILNRYIAYAGVGNNWVDTPRRHFATTYGLSYTDREEEKPDPEKDRRFAGARFGWDYTEHFTSTTTFDSDFALNTNLSDTTDYSISTTNALTVAMTGHISIKASLQWLYEHEPALESDLDVIAYVEVVNPDGVPGSGDESFRTLSSGDTKLVLGSMDARKDRLDTIVRTSLVIKF
jgi:hypothetical protein